MRNTYIHRYSGFQLAELFLHGILPLLQPTDMASDVNVCTFNIHVHSACLIYHRADALASLCKIKQKHVGAHAKDSGSEDEIGKCKSTQQGYTWKGTKNCYWVGVG
jgi:hypothetical protein